MAKTTKPCIVINKVGSTLKVCYQGNKAFIGTQHEAQEHANLLKSINKECDYRIYTIQPIAAEGELVEKFAGNPAESAGRVRPVTRRKK